MADDSRSRPQTLRARAQPVQARSLESRRRILDAAHAVLKTNGVHQFTTVAIAEASGVSVGALYRFFPNKESIICELYEQKLEEVRKLGAVNSGGPDRPWRAFFEGYFTALKAAERQVDFDFSLADAIFQLPQLWEIDRRHGVLVADQIVADMKMLGATWSDAALFDLAINLYALDAATWMYWRYAKRYPALAVERVMEASLNMMRPAMEGEAEPPVIELDRDALIAG